MPHPVQTDDWILIQGEHVSRVYTFETSLGSPYDLSGKVLRCHFRRYPEGIEILLDASIVASNPTEGEATLEILPPVSALLSGTLVYDILACDPDGTGAVRLVQGTVPVSPAVTR